MNKTIFFLITMTVAVAATSDDWDKNEVQSEGIFEDFSDKMKIKVKNIEKEFGDEANVSLGKAKEGSIIIQFKRENRNKLCAEYINEIKKNKVNDDDTNSIKKEIEVYEKNGINLLKKAGFPVGTKFTLKVAEKPFKTYGKVSKKQILKEGILLFDECYNGIRIEDSRSAIFFLRENVFRIRVAATANMKGISIASSIPKVTFNDALKQYLSTSEKLKLIKRPIGYLCYILNENKRLILCWKIQISAVSDSKNVYVNAETGETVKEASTTHPD